jgi:DNA-directed RNA polymerase subunit RPC12/RpoP
MKLSCPSCGGHLELPENLEVAHCMYCGAKILLQESEVPKEHIHLKRYKELCKTALTAKNYEDALQYSNKALEIDPKDVEAWIDKYYSAMSVEKVASRASLDLRWDR